MTVPEQTPYIEHTGNGVTTSFALKFQCESKDHLIVLVDEIEPPIATWSLTGGNIVFTTAPASGSKIILQRNTPFSRTVDYQSYNNSFRPPAVNKDFDWIWLKLQELGVADWILGNRIDALKNYVDDRDDELRAYLMEEIRKQGVALDQLDDYYNYLMQRLAQIAVDKGWNASFVVYHGISQKKINDGLDSIAEMLAIQNPFNGMRVFVKSYRPGNGVGYLGEATPYKGGNCFIYKSSRAAENDGVFVFNGWERFLESDTYSPYMAGCACDGVTDDAQKLDKLNYALQYNKLKGRVVFDKDIFINSELPRTGSMTHVSTGIKCGVRLVGGVHYEIQSGVSIKIGSYFNNSETQVFCAANPSNPSDWTDFFPQDDVHLFGAGTIDSTQAGSMASQHYNNRYLVFLGGCTNFHMYGLTTVGGDYGNIVVGRNKAKGIRFYNNHVKDTTVTASSSHDHSSIWTTAPDCKVYNNRFTDSSPKAQIQMCAFESHGNEHYFYNNTVDGFLVSVLQCAYGWDLTNQPTKNNMFVYGNNSRSWYFMQLWYKGGAFQPYGFMDTFDNVHTAMPYISRDALIAAGVKASIVDMRKLLKRAFLSTNNAIAKDYEMTVQKALQFHDNKFFASFSPELEEQFYDMEILMNEGIHIFDNYMKTPKLFTIKNQFTHLGVDFPHVIKNYIWKNNTVDYSGAMSTKPILELNVHRLNGCTFENHIGQTYPTGLPSRTGGSFSVVDPDNSKGNKLSFTFDGQTNITAGISGFGSITNAPFFANNKIIVDQKLTCYLKPLNSDPKRAQFYCTDGNRNFSGIEVMSYPAAAFGSFPMPAKLFNSSAHTDRFIGVSFDFSDTNTDTTTKSGSVFARLFN
ncbi:hypothetical protein [Acinetobacter lwoffii]|uniref:hypothetical protein n=1 Tax=Acinetobacter lwoffii TaxID=28090 RepID=UPI001FF3AA4B|nr:hypothetical protein [Acinetobacter lwoffii]MCJ8512258.1 hypothetical protein [Acinetobacter lwoffii]